jgi:hypothetical protein
MKSGAKAARTARRAAALVLIGAAASAQTDPGVSAEDVGDADSFGRNVIYLGVANTPAIAFKTNCTNSPPPAPARCVTLNAQPALTSFSEDKLETLVLPAKSTNSLLCFSVTPNLNFLLHNQTGLAQPMARFGARPTVVLENELLNDSSLIDPTTGLPFDGRITFGLATYFESRNMAVGEREYKNIFLTRHCIEGINRRVLSEAYGLPAAVVQDFFGHPITLTFGAAGEAQLVGNASYSYGVRVYGDGQ